MAVNGRQKAMLGALTGASRRSAFNPPDNPLLGVDPLDALKALVKEIEAGNIAIKDLSMETFRNPRSFATMDRSFQSIVPGDCFATVQFEIAPSGRVRDDYIRPTVNVRVNGVDTGMSREQLDEIRREIADDLEPLTDGVRDGLDDLDDLPSPSFAADRAQDKREAKAKREPAKPATPTGASAAREVIFDDGDAL